VCSESGDSLINETSILSSARHRVIYANQAKTTWLFDAARKQGPEVPTNELRAQKFVFSSVPILYQNV
jgi:hypothetical protein